MKGRNKELRQSTKLRSWQRAQEPRKRECQAHACLDSFAALQWFAQ
jgi:hypothetical protein